MLLCQVVLGFDIGSQARGDSTRCVLLLGQRLAVADWEGWCAN